LKTPDAPRALRALKCVFDGKTLEYIKLLLAFDRTAHYWTEIHPELVLEDDINQLLATREAIAACVLAEVAEADPHCSSGGAGAAMRVPNAHFLACG
jgi:hypothetical protein